MKKVNIILKSGTSINVVMEDDEVKELRQQFQMNSTSVYTKSFKTTTGTLDICLLPVHAILVKDIEKIGEE